MAILTYKPCKCIRRGDCILPGTRGHLYVRIGKREIFVAACRYCRPKDNRLDERD